MERIEIRHTTKEDLCAAEALGDRISKACANEPIDRTLLALTLFTSYVIGESPNPDLMFKTFVINLNQLLEP
jgi:hypothetical protein